METAGAVQRGSILALSVTCGDISPPERGESFPDRGKASVETVGGMAEGEGAIRHTAKKLSPRESCRANARQRGWAVVGRYPLVTDHQPPATVQ